MVSWTLIVGTALLAGRLPKRQGGTAIMTGLRWGRAGRITASAGIQRGPGQPVIVLLDGERRRQQPLEGLLVEVRLGSGRRHDFPAR